MPDAPLLPLSAAPKVDTAQSEPLASAAPDASACLSHVSLIVRTFCPAGPTYIIYDVFSVSWRSPRQPGGSSRLRPPCASGGAAAVGACV